MKRSRVFFGWYVVACAFLIALWGWGLGFYGLGVYLVSLRDTRGWSVSAISGAITAYYLVGAALIAVLGRLTRRLGSAATVLGAVLAMALAVSALTVVTRPWQLYPVFALMAVGWAGMSGAILNLLIAPWFRERRGLALSVAFTGASAGGVVVGPALLWLVARLGFERGVRAAALAMLAVLVPVVVAVLRRGPAPPDLASHGDVRTAGEMEAKVAPIPPPGRVARPLRSRAFWTISIPFAAGLAAQVGIITHQVAFLTPHAGAAGAGLGVSLTALAAIAGRFLLAPFVDRIDARVAACLNFLPQVAGVTLLVARPSGAALYAGCVLFGLGVGNMVSLPGLLVAREFSPAQFAGVVSLVTAINQVAFGFAPALMGLLRDASGDYALPLVACIVLQVLAGAVVLLGRGRARQEVPSMLQLRPNCECCDRDLPADSADAFICSFECTFCRACAERVLGGRCPNCGGELVRRPARPPDKLTRFPASAERVVRREPCPRASAALEGAGR